MIQVNSSKQGLVYYDPSIEKCRRIEDNKVVDIDSHDGEVLVDCSKYKLKYGRKGKRIKEAWIDVDIVDEIKSLWELGIKTLACCSGHGLVDFDYIFVEKKSIKKMEELGYIHKNKDEDIFHTKTKLKKQKIQFDMIGAEYIPEIRWIKIDE